MEKTTVIKHENNVKCLGEYMKDNKLYRCNGIRKENMQVIHIMKTLNYTRTIISVLKQHMEQ